MPRKCSVYGCRSGYNPTKKNRSRSRSRSRSKDSDIGLELLDLETEKVTVHCFPSDKEECQKWIDALPNANLRVENITQHVGVCAKHWPSDVPKINRRGKYRPSVPPSCFSLSEEPPTRSRSGSTPSLRARQKTSKAHISVNILLNGASSQKQLSMVVKDEEEVKPFPSSLENKAEEADDFGQLSSSQSVSVENDHIKEELDDPNDNVLAKDMCESTSYEGSLPEVKLEIPEKEEEVMGESSMFPKEEIRSEEEVLKSSDVFQTSGEAKESTSYEGSLPEVKLEIPEEEEEVIGESSMFPKEEIRSGEEVLKSSDVFQTSGEAKEFQGFLPEVKTRNSEEDKFASESSLFSNAVSQSVEESLKSSDMPQTSYETLVAKELVKPQLEGRQTVQHLSRHLQHAIQTAIADYGLQAEVSITRKRGRCHICSRKMDLKTTLRCSSCSQFVCSKHSRKIRVCHKC